ncbi:MAG: NADH:ubiquinone reductase (Na(+)-transporting) subunit C [Prevotella sp.]|nr:NADH:ubiquinone reductase (Na(+)-transporting) subunit C [Prevotella sp.]
MAGNKETKKVLNTNSNTYIIIYSSVMVVIVAFLLAFISQALKPAQDSNVALDKKKQILAALNIRDLDNVAAAAKYSEVVTADEIIDKDGHVTAPGTQGGEEDGFKLNSADFKAGRLALYVCNVDGATKYVVPVYGMGLWGPIWGYIAINEDKNTVYGAYFNHDSETAGLGAEIKDNKEWQSKFIGKKIFSDADGDAATVALAVKKTSDIKNPASEVDGVTGATLTSNGVSDMLGECLGAYKVFLNEK